MMKTEYYKILKKFYMDDKNLDIDIFNERMSIIEYIDSIDEFVEKDFYISPYEILKDEDNLKTFKNHHHDNIENYVATQWIKTK